MKGLHTLSRIGRRGFPLLLAAALLVGLPTVRAHLQEPGAASSEGGLGFREIAPQGFGDRHNTKAWSMIWWKGHLYVGTARAHMCVEYAGLADTVGGPFKYPPDDPDMECTEDVQDLPLNAEIWRYTPQTDTWDRVFLSPDTPVPDNPEKTTGRDAGFRNIIAFTDPDGTEALYAGGVTSESIMPGMPPPRILRSTDGEHWDPVPQVPGTVLGDLGRGQANFRAMEVYKDRLYVSNGALRGGGNLMEAENPAAGNDEFRWINPELRVYEMAVYNDQLYVGTVATSDDPRAGYAVVRTDATGEPPYTFTAVVDRGGYLPLVPSNAVVSMFVYEGRLYVGTDKPSELIRINPDDTWDLVVGTPRETPDGMKEPLSGLGPGFDWWLNEHIWRIDEYLDKLYVGTNDATGFIKEYRFSEPFMEAMGYDLFVSPNGIEYALLTRTAFYGEGLCDDQFGIGIRVFAPTPYGLFFGTSDPFHGLRIYRGEPDYRFRSYVPLVQGASSLPLSGAPTHRPDEAGRGLRVGLRPLGEVERRPDPPSAPAHLGLENSGGAAVLSWDPALRAERYRVFRSTLVPARDLGIATDEPEARVPQPFSEIGTSDQPFFVDRTTQADSIYHYYVLAEGPGGALSSPSNLARSPSLNSPVTMSSLRQATSDWARQGEARAQVREGDVASALRHAQERLDSDDLQGMLVGLDALRSQARLNRLPRLTWWHAEDLERLLDGLTRRVRLAQHGIISPRDLR